MDRRSFIKKASLFTAMNIFCVENIFAKNIGTFDSAELAFNAMGISLKDGNYFAGMGDPHFNIERTRTHYNDLFNQVADELKTYSPAPAFLAMLGDLISNGNKCAGDVSKNHNMAIKELELLKAGIDRLKPIEPKLVFGNHDTIEPKDFDNVLYKKYMPELKSYYSFDFAGVHFITLNGLHCAMLDDAQLKWLKDDIAKLKGQDIVIFIHQPVGSVSSEYKAGLVIRDIVNSYKGDVKIIAGHTHTNAQMTLHTPSGKTASQFVLEAPRKNKAPVYWLFAVRDGKIAGAVFRNKDAKFEAYSFDGKKRDWLEPFEKQNYKAVFSPLSSEYEERKVEGWFNPSKCIYYYYFLKHLEVGVDLSKVGEYSKLTLLGSRLRGEKAKTKFRLSLDGENWTDFEPTKEDNFYYEFDLTENFRNKKKLYVDLWTGHVGANFTCVAVK